MQKKNINNPDPERNDHRWGFKDTSFMIKDGHTFFKSDRYSFMRNVYLPAFIPYVEGVLGIKNIIKQKNQEVPQKKITPPLINNRFLQQIKKKFKPQNYSLDDQVRLNHSHGQMTTDEIYHLLYTGKIDRLADMVFFPYQEKEVEDLIKLAVKNKICLIPYGGGTSVSGALLLPAKEKRMVVCVDMRFMNKILWIDRENLTACIETGIIGRHLEEQLQQKGYTMGHEPDSVEFSTLGGWIATHASGMKRNKYGNIEDIVKGYHLCTPSGKIRHTNHFDRTSVGMDTKKIFYGNEGNLGILTQAIVKIHLRPKINKYASILFPDFNQGVDFLKALAKTNYIAASVRLVDNIQFRFGYALKEKETRLTQTLIDQIKKWILIKVKKFDPYKMCLLTLVFEGKTEEVSYQQKNSFKLAKKHGGISAGEANGKRGYMLTHLIAYIRDFLFDYYIIGETFETTVPWNKIDIVCRAAKAELEKRHLENRLPARPYISWRITQIYHSDVCVYFTMGIYVKGVRQADKVYSKIEKQIRAKIIEAGGSISHHHGIGKIRKDFMKEIYSKSEINLLKNLKKTLDPDNTFGIGNNVFAIK